MPNRDDREQLLRRSAELKELAFQACTESAGLKAKSSQLLATISRNTRAANDTGPAIESQL